MENPEAKLRCLCVTRCCGLLICSWSWKLLLSFSVRSKLYWGIGFLHAMTELFKSFKNNNGGEKKFQYVLFQKKKKKESNASLKLQCFTLTCRSALTSYSWPRFHIHHIWTVFLNKHTPDVAVQPTYDVTANTRKAEETPPSDFLSIPSRKGRG